MFRSMAFSIGSISGVRENGPAGGYAITNFPNPVSDAATIRFVLPIRSFIKITIADELGREVNTLAWRSFEAGIHTIPFNALQLFSGVYTYTLKVGKVRVSGTMTIVK